MKRRSTKVPALRAGAFLRGYGNGGYIGARSNRASLQEWFPGNGSADGDTAPDLATLRARSRDLRRNAPLAHGAIETHVINTVGAGLTPQPSCDWQALGISREAGAAFNLRAAQLWDAWANTTACDVSSKLTFGDLCNVAYRSALESGDLLALRRFREDGDSPLGLRIQLIEADRVSNPGNSADTEQLVQGVEMDRDGRPLRYHVQDRHPGDGFGGQRWTPVDAMGSASGLRRVLHVALLERPNQTRGVPILAPVIEPLRQLGTYTTNELAAAVASSLITIFVKREAQAGLAGGLQAQDDEAPAPSAGQYRLKPGAMVDLEPGEDITSFNPNRPNAQFDPFFTAMTKQIGLAVGLPFEVLLLHFNASYSASRAALLEAWRRFTTRRAWLVRAMCQPIYEWMLDEAIARGLVQAPGWNDPLKRRAWSYATWTGPTRGEIDELKAITAAGERMDRQMTTLEQETMAHSGGDWAANVEQAGREQESRRAAGLIVTTPATTAVIPGDPSTDPFAADPFDPASPGAPSLPPS